MYQDLDAIEKDGEYGVTVTTKRPFGSLPSHLTMLGMLPPGAGKGEDAFFQKPIGTGPFRFASWTHGDQIALFCAHDVTEFEQSVRGSAARPEAWHLPRRPDELHPEALPGRP